MRNLSKLCAMLALAGCSLGCSGVPQNVATLDVDLCSDYPLESLGQPEDGLFIRELYDAQAAASSMGYSVSCRLTPVSDIYTANVTIRAGESFCDMRYNPDTMRAAHREYGRYTIVALFGHEIGHVISTMETGGFMEPVKSQLFSDRVAGRTLHILGVNHEEFDMTRDWFSARGESRTEAFVGGYEECK